TFVVNLDAKPRTVDGVNLASYGFTAASPTMRAALRQGEPGFVSSGTARNAEAWVLAHGGETARIDLPAAPAGAVAVRVDGTPVAAQRDGARLTLKLPDLTAVATKPAVWPGKAVAVIDLGAGVGLSWSTVQPAQYVAALTASKLGAPRVLRSATEVARVLEQGPADVWAIINPYGEQLPAEPGAARAQIDRVKAFVGRGGVWWETGGYSFHNGGGQVVGPDGLGGLGIPVGGGEVDAPAEPLNVTSTGRAWLGDALAGRVQALVSPVNRGLPRSSADPGHVALVSAARDGGDDFIGGYRLGGYGWLWRIGGFNPNPAVVTPVVVATLEYLAAHPPLDRAAAR
ncbi:MAG: hypothetical protein HZB16_08850, partial [Armatimonadetes bacterium]|nr:hypothetical protein [Armatimonadota bacterium]